MAPSCTPCALPEPELRPQVFCDEIPLELQAIRANAVETRAAAALQSPPR
jgi:hypothetical protein